MSLDVLQHGPLLVIPVISSLSVGLKLLDSGGGGPAWADPVHRGRDSLAEPRLDGPYFAEYLEQHRLHALVYVTVRRHDAFRTQCLCLCAWLGGAAVSHWATVDGRQETGGEEPANWQVGAAAGSLRVNRALTAPHKTTRTSQRQLADNPPVPASLVKLRTEQYPSILDYCLLTGAVKMSSRRSTNKKLANLAPPNG